jgi:hypothetical protein
MSIQAATCEVSRLKLKNRDIRNGTSNSTSKMSLTMSVRPMSFFHHGASRVYWTMNAVTETAPEIRTILSSSVIS